MASLFTTGKENVPVGPKVHVGLKTFVLGFCDRMRIVNHFLCPQQCNTVQHQTAQTSITNANKYKYSRY